MSNTTVTITTAEYEALIQAAYYDELTSLANRRKLTEDFNGQAVLYADLNKFKPVNDTHGHDAGDKVLVDFSQMLDSVGQAYRLGGDEFVVLTSSPEAVAEAINAWVGPYEVTATVGQGEGETLGEALKAADEAMYAIKGHGRR